jgi:hypothetical protein
MRVVKMLGDGQPRARDIGSFADRGDELRKLEFGILAAAMNRVILRQPFSGCLVYASVEFYFE